MTQIIRDVCTGEAMHKNRPTSHNMEERGKFANILSEIGIDIAKQVKFRNLADWQLSNV